MWVREVGKRIILTPPATPCRVGEGATIHMK